MDKALKIPSYPLMVRKDVLPYVASVVVVAATVLVLLWMGRAAMCDCGYIRLWHGVDGPEASKHAFDIYSFHHVIHGFIFFAMTSFVLKKHMPGWGLFTGTLIESIWEISENTDRLIQRYRDATISLTYSGDTVVNSVADYGAMWFGFWLAYRLPVRATVALTLIFEFGSYILIKDSLAVTIFNLLFGP